MTNETNNGAALELRNMLVGLACMFLRRPMDLKVAVEQVGKRVAVEARPHPEDVGRMNGAHGAMSHALTALLVQAAHRRGLACHYALHDPNSDEDRAKLRRDGQPFAARGDWPEGAIMGLLRSTCASMFDLPVKVEAAPRRGDYDQGYKTWIHLKLHPDEPRRTPDMELRDALSTVFHAIGANNGRRIYVATLEREKA